MCALSIQLELVQSIRLVLARHGLQDNVELEMELVAAVNRTLQESEAPANVQEHRQRTLEALAKGYEREEGIQVRWHKLFGTEPNWETKTCRKLAVLVKTAPAGQTLEQFAEWWYEEDWRGKAGQPPSAAQALEYWGLAFATEESKHYRERAMPLPEGI